MLLYNKALDPNHTLLRMISIVYHIERDVIEKERLRIFDFLLSFPEHLTTMNLGRKLMYKKRVFKKYKNNYSNYDSYTLFNSMNEIQECVLSNLVQLSILKNQPSNDFSIHRDSIPSNLLEIINDEENSIPNDALTFLTSKLSDIDLLGKNGIKHSSRLMDSKYDSV